MALELARPPPAIAHLGRFLQTFKSDIDLRFMDFAEPAGSAIAGHVATRSLRQQAANCSDSSLEYKSLPRQSSFRAADAKIGMHTRDNIASSMNSFSV